MTMLPIRTALLWIWGSTILFSGGVVLALTLKQKWDGEVRHNPQFMIRSIVQKCATVETLPTNYLAECLGLSQDHSYTLFEKSTGELEQILASSPLMQHVSVSKNLPSTLIIEYGLRQPVAAIHDLSNTVVDAEGVLFPLQPFRTPKLLPELVLGEPNDVNLQWGLEMISYLKTREFPPPIKGLKKIDLTRSDHPRLSRKEIVMVFNSDFDKLTYLRVSPDNWRKGIDHFLRIPSDSLPGMIVDLRLTDTAFVKPIEQPKGEKK